MAQQQWASQSASWTFEDGPATAWNVDQQVWLPVTADGSFWFLGWTWSGAPGIGGYLGFQQRAGGQQQARFSIWDATAAKGPTTNESFGGEGVGETCHMPMTLRDDRWYRLRLWRTDEADDGQWWGAWIIEDDGAGGLTEHHVGQIKAPSAHRAVDVGSISNAVEYFGDAVPTCDDVPASTVVCTPPAVDDAGSGTGRHGGYSTYATSRRADENVCAPGVGAHITATSTDVGFAAGVTMFLGGAATTHVLDTDEHPVPPDMPDS